MKKTKVNIFIEVLLLILVPVILILLMAPNIIESVVKYRKDTFITTAKLIAVSAEGMYLSNNILGIDKTIMCEDVIALDDNIKNCGIYINDNTAFITLNGKEKYENMNIFGKSYDSITLSEDANDLCIMNEFINVEEPYEVGNYEDCINYTKETFSNLRNYKDDEIDAFCKGKEVKGWTFSDNIEYLLNKGFSKKDLIENNVIKGSINNVCIPKDIHITCYTYSIKDKEDGKYVEITGYDDRCGSNIIIPSELNGVSVEGIGESAFLGKNIKSIKLPNTIRYIGNNAFRGESESIDTTISGLLDLSNVSSLETIGYFAFADNKITELKLPNNIKKIQGYAFSENEISGVLDFSNTNIESIGEFSFSSNKIENILFSSSIKQIGCTAFAGNQITGVLDLSNLTNLNTIELEVFSENQISNIILPNNITSINNSAFSYNNISEELDLSNTNIKMIGSNAFIYNNITSIKLPNSIEKIGNGAFERNIVSNPNLSVIHNTSNNIFDWVLITKEGEENKCTFAKGKCGNIKIVNK